VRESAFNALWRASIKRLASAVVLCSLVGFKAVASEPPLPVTGEEFSGGETTVFDTSRNAFTLAARNLRPEHRTPFFVGNSFFNENWVAAPASTAARDGLGPLFTARSCSACHFKDGRGAPSVDTMVFRLSVPGVDAHGAPLPDPVYGGQLQTRAVHEAQPEAEVLIRHVEQPGAFADGEPYSLRRPSHAFTNAAYGTFAPGLMVSARVAPAVIGLGLLEAIPESAVRALADPDDRDGDGISGRLNEVWDFDLNRRAIGRFGWKAEQPTVRQQIAAAFNGDMGLTTPVFASENHTAAQLLDKLANGGSPEVGEDIFNAVVLYTRTLAVPARRDWTNEVMRRGGTLFRQLDCAACHTPEWTTGDWPEFPELSGQTIRPYTDLLLHDLGDGLADGRPVFGASGREWRTPPLWGIGLVETVNGHSFFLHDGRARSLAEAILWHGGEAEAAKERFRRLSRPDREALVKFLQSL